MKTTLKMKTTSKIGDFLNNKDDLKIKTASKLKMTIKVRGGGSLEFQTLSKIEL